MTLAQVESYSRTENSLQRKVFSELYKKVSPEFFDEEAAVSEAAEELYKRYSTLYNITHSKESLEKARLVRQGIIPCKSYEEVEKEVLSLPEKDRTFKAFKSVFGKNTKVSTFKEVIDFLSLK